MSDSRSDLDVPATGLLPEAPPPDTDQHEPGERQPNPRDALMASIAAKAEAVRQREVAQGAIYEQEARANGMALVNDDPDDLEPEAVSFAEPQAQPERRAEPPPRTPEPPAHSSAPETFAVEIDGQQIHVTPEQMKALAKMGMVANQALHLYQNQPPPQQRQAQPEPEHIRPMVDDARVRETIKKIQYGNEDDAAEALSGLIREVRLPAPQQQPVVDPMAIANYAVSEAKKQAQFDRDAAIIKEEFADLFVNAARSNAAAAAVTALRNRNHALGQQQSDLEIYREAGRYVRESFGMPGPQADAPPPNGVVVRPRSEAERRKRDGTPRSSQAIDRRVALPAEPRPPTTSDIVEMMRKQRGQPPMR